MERAFGRFPQIGTTAILCLPGTKIVHQHSDVVDIENVQTTVHSETYRKRLESGLFNPNNGGLHIGTISVNTICTQTRNEISAVHIGMSTDSVAVATVWDCLYR